MRPRYSLRTLLLVMTLIAALFGWRWVNFRRAEEFAKRLNSGGTLKFLEARQTVVGAYVLGNERQKWHEWWLPPVVVKIRTIERGLPFHFRTKRRQSLTGF